MGHDAIKLELIQWLSRLEDEQTLNYLRIVKESSETDSDWWHELTESQKAGIERGLNDIAEGRIVAHLEVKRKYGL
ncbi:MAG: hypothetical protein U0T82_00715 [Bacteroidales bacterium]